MHRFEVAIMDFSNYLFFTLINKGIAMILTGKAKEEFLKWNYEDDFGYIDIEPRSLTVHFDDLYDNLQYALIIEWFDSVGIFIHIEPYLGGGKECFYCKVIYRNELFLDQMEEINNGEYLENRQEATKQAIIKANEIYNKL